MSRVSDRASPAQFGFGTTVAIAAAPLILAMGLAASGPAVAAPLAGSYGATSLAASGGSVATVVSGVAIPAPHPRRRIAAAPPATAAPQGAAAQSAAPQSAAPQATARAVTGTVRTPRAHPGRSPAALGFAAAPAAATGGGAAPAPADASRPGGIGAIFSMFSNQPGGTTAPAAAAPTGRPILPGAPAAPAPRTSAPVLASAPAAAPTAGNLARASGGDPWRAHAAASGTFRQALDALRADRYEEVFRRRNGLRDPLERKTIDWLLVRSGSPKVSHAMIADFARDADGWPSPRIIRSRLEAALSRERPPADRVIAAFSGTTPQTIVGTRLLARAHLARGDKSKAAAVLRPVWHSRRMSRDLQTSIAKEFSGVLTADDHRRRAEMLLYNDRAREAEALKAYLGSADDAYIDARASVVRRDGNATRRIAAVPQSARNRPGYLFAQIAQARRAEDWDNAARLLERSPRNADALIDPDEWWVERRIVSRALNERGDHRRAYAIASAHSATGAAAQVDAEFHAGWYALRFLKEPGKARPHFQRVRQIGTTPITLSRAEYWLGRTAEAAGNRGAAAGHYRAAAAYGFTYYGQLARRELNQGRTGVTAVRAGPGDAAAFRRNEQVRAIRKLVAAGHQHRVFPLFDYLSETLPSAGQLVLLAELAEEIGKPHIAVIVGKEGQRRGLNVGAAAFPTKAIPRSASVAQGLDRAIVYAIARQESTFNTGAISPAGARGLMQLMPGTARSMSRKLGLSYSASRLLTDPAYNVALGSNYLAQRINGFGGSYVLAFAAYNAGASRSREWIGRFGDPRGDRLDVVDWVESIPFTETRNYVMRVMENVQVYRELLGTGRLAIDDDLARGRPG